LENGIGDKVQKIFLEAFEEEGNWEISDKEKWNLALVALAAISSSCISFFHFPFRLSVCHQNAVLRQDWGKLEQKKG
jgi:hypothetical protein